MPRKKFGGKFYALEGNWTTKKGAKEEAAKLRKKGYLVRVENTKGYGFVNHFVWKRKR